jgi:hypothetical protein
VRFVVEADKVVIEGSRDDLWSLVGDIEAALRGLPRMGYLRTPEGTAPIIVNVTAE